MTITDEIDRTRGVGARRWVGVSLALLAAAACGPASSGAGEDEGAGRDGVEGEHVGRTDGEVPVCLEGDDFRAEGELVSSVGEGAGEGVGDRAAEPAGSAVAADVGAFRHERHEEACERFVVDLLGTDGEPAEAAGEVRVELLREPGVVRIRMPDVRPDVVEATDATFDGPLATAAYAVRGQDRRIHVDLHLGEPATARALVLRSPARVVVDLRPGGEALSPPAARHRRVVVLEPRGREASYPLEITGYARTFEANVLARIRQGGVVRTEEFTTAHDWVGTWGAFRIVVEEGPTGAVELFVGEESARDGTEEGVRLDLLMR